MVTYLHCKCCFCALPKRGLTVLGSGRCRTQGSEAAKGSRTCSSQSTGALPSCSPQICSLWFMLQQTYLDSSFSVAFPAENSRITFKINNIIAPSYYCKVGRGHRRKKWGSSDQSEKTDLKKTHLSEFESLKTEPAGGHPAEGWQERETLPSELPHLGIVSGKENKIWVVAFKPNVSFGITVRWVAPSLL